MPCRPTAVGRARGEKVELAGNLRGCNASPRLNRGERLFVGQDREGWIGIREERWKLAGVPGIHQAESGVTAHVASDGTLSFRDPAGFDLNDAIWRAPGSDPYTYAKKKYADATFDDRLQRAALSATRRKQQALLHSRMMWKRC